MAGARVRRYNEVKFAQGDLFLFPSFSSFFPTFWLTDPTLFVDCCSAKKKKIILLRMIPWDQEFDELQGEPFFSHSLQCLIMIILAIDG